MVSTNRHLRELVLLALALPLSAGIIIIPNHPNYGPQLPIGLPALNLGDIPILDLQRQFPQNDYAEYGGLVCYFDRVNPAVHDVCAPPLVPWAPLDYVHLDARVMVPPTVPVVRTPEAGAGWFVFVGLVLIWCLEIIKESPRL